MYVCMYVCVSACLLLWLAREAGQTWKRGLLIHVVQFSHHQTWRPSLPDLEIRAACYRTEKWGNPENGWGGCWEECCENSECWREWRRGCCEGGPFLGKEWGAAPSPALPPAPRIFAALFPPAIFWISPFLYSVAGRPDLNPDHKTLLTYKNSRWILLQRLHEFQT